MSKFESNNDFHVILSKWKVWTLSILCLLISCIPLLALVIFLEPILTGKTAISTDFIFRMVIFGPMFLFFAGIAIYIIRQSDAPFSRLTSNEFSGTKNFKKRSFVWTPNTVLYSIKNNNIVLANLDASQSRAGKLWGGPKEAVIVYNSLAKQKREDVLAAIDRLSPYPVERTTLWGTASR